VPLAELEKLSREAEPLLAPTEACERRSP
jgi:hypothetical protein